MFRHPHMPIRCWRMPQGRRWGCSESQGPASVLPTKEKVVHQWICKEISSYWQRFFSTNIINYWLEKLTARFVGELVMDPHLCPSKCVWSNKYRESFFAMQNSYKLYDFILSVLILFNPHQKYCYECPSLFIIYFPL
jgi:hypothetical protein